MYYQRNPDALLQMAKRDWEAEPSRENAERYINLLRRSGAPFGESLPMSKIRSTKDSRYIRRHIKRALNSLLYTDGGSPIGTVDFYRNLKKSPPWSYKADVAGIYYEQEQGEYGELTTTEALEIADVVNRVVGGEIAHVYFQVMADDPAIIRIDVDITYH